MWFSVFYFPSEPVQYEFRVPELRFASMNSIKQFPSTIIFEKVLVKIQQLNTNPDGLHQSQKNFHVCTSVYANCNSRSTI